MEMITPELEASLSVSASAIRAPLGQRSFSVEKRKAHALTITRLALLQEQSRLNNSDLSPFWSSMNLLLWRAGKSGRSPFDGPLTFIAGTRADNSCRGFASKVFLFRIGVAVTVVVVSDSHSAYLCDPSAALRFIRFTAVITAEAQRTLRYAEKTFEAKLPAAEPMMNWMNKSRRHR